jgi:hypothetical protein
MINLEIKNESRDSIKNSFDRIAVDLINNWNLKINSSIYSFTEIEFYYFLSGLHEDKATHEHLYNIGQWRWHQQGLDITFQGSKGSDGGILLRGIKSSGTYINGPKRILEEIFKRFGNVTIINKEFGLVPKVDSAHEIIHKTIRHGISTKQENEFVEEPYRYYTDIDAWDIKHKSMKEKEKIKRSSRLHDYR